MCILYILIWLLHTDLKHDIISRDQVRLSENFLDTHEDERTLPYSRVRSITTPLSASLDALVILLTDYSIASRDFADKNKELLFKLARTLLWNYLWTNGLGEERNGIGRLDEVYNIMQGQWDGSRPLREVVGARNDIGRWRWSANEGHQIGLSSEAIDVLSEVAGHYCKLMHWWLVISYDKINLARIPFLDLTDVVVNQKAPS